MSDFRFSVTMKELPAPRIHPSADIDPSATIGKGSLVWHQVQIREHASIGSECTLSKGVYIDRGVTIGNRVKVQNHVSIYQGVTLEDGVFVGPNATFTNDFQPRSVTRDGELRTENDWKVIPTVIREGAAICANATVICGITIGKWAMIGAGAVITRDVPDHALMVGVPARIMGFVSYSGNRMVEDETPDLSKLTVRMRDLKSDEIVEIPTETSQLWKKI